MLQMLLKMLCSKGMFKDERTVCFCNHENVLHWMFADIEHVVEEGNTKYLKVELVDTKNDLFLVELPCYAHGPGWDTRFVTVRRDHLDYKDCDEQSISPSHGRLSF